MSKYKGLFTFDVDNHRYVTVGAADGIITNMDYRPESEPKEPLIKDAGMREAMRLWAKVNLIPSNATTIEYQFADTLNGKESEFWNDNLHIMFYGNIAPEAVNGKCYTIDELCGEEGK